MPAAELEEFISSLSPTDLKRLIAMTRNVAGPWQENPYAPGRQWFREHLRESKSCPTYVVIRSDDDMYRIMKNSKIFPSAYEDLDAALVGADAYFRHDGWILFDV